ncbi:MAG: Rieske 2Fe-2S domain-containing protein [Planctomycetes bacterium]|nr:Rieske 2Fe-2S domain-containing protein [Planctomycetota bacterium]
MQFVRIGAVNEIADGQGRLIEADGRQIAVFNCGGRFYAIDEICPHMGGPLSEGTVEGDCVICPWHGWEFNIRTGESPTGGNQQTFSVKVEDGSVFVAVPPRA